MCFFILINSKKKRDNLSLSIAHMGQESSNEASGLDLCQTTKETNFVMVTSQVEESRIQGDPHISTKNKCSFSEAS